MLIMIVVIAISAACAGVASYVMWWACNRSGLWSMVAGVVLGLAAILGAVIIGYFITRSTLPH